MINWRAKEKKNSEWAEKSVQFKCEMGKKAWIKIIIAKEEAKTLHTYMHAYIYI